MPHLYHLSLKHLADQKGNSVGETVCEFDFHNHDDLAKIIQKAKDNGVVPESEVFEFCLGLKLLTKIAMKHRDEPEFAEFFPHLGTFIRAIKAPRTRETA
ncbi:hypothetical protein IE4803_PA00288 (plasmid) [Rhizobium etli bv. phaseoli str. IE4803]|nr:hypothetical protein IE4803_PA00288 [Rhizobium etli bv. phaseoli str. IE4803]